MKKKIISFITSATMTLTCLGGGFSEITSRLNLTSELIVAEAAESGTYGDLSYYNSGFGFIVIDGCDKAATMADISLH